MSTSKAVIRWLTSEEGGRKSIPFGPRYTTMVKFLEHSEKWRIEGWDLVVDKLGDCEIQTPIWHAIIAFRVEDAPHQWLVSGAKFELYEGNKLVAAGGVE